MQKIDINRYPDMCLYVPNYGTGFETIFDTKTGSVVSRT